MRMHADEIETDAALVHGLIAAQFPQWAGLPVKRVPSAGTDNALYRVGEELVARLPRRERLAQAIAFEVEWMPRLAPLLPVAVPEVVAMGEPAERYPCPWALYRWLPGENPVVGELRDADGLALELGSFVRALRAVELADPPVAGRGVPLVERDAPTRQAIGELEGMVDAAAATALWEQALGAPAWDGPTRWMHGDLASFNLIVRDGRLAGVIDWSGAGVGDPAVDLMPAWQLLPAASRDAFRETTAVDDATWARGRGWALSVALIQLPYYAETNPALAASARRMIEQVLADRG
jgi:aminoglycoside phosphotransferase (APT) family kinase protein